MNDTIERLGNGFAYARSCGEGYNSGFGDGRPPITNAWGNGKGCGCNGYADGDGNGVRYSCDEDGNGDGEGWAGANNGFALLICSDPLWLICMGNNV